MRELFPGHYRPKREEFEHLWQECIFVFDANVLLDVYRYTPSTSERLLDIMRRLRDRIWLPHQVVKEYLDNRLNVISQQEKIYGEIDKLLRNTLETLEKHRRHPSIDFDELSKIYSSAYKKAQAALRKTQSGHPDLIENDPLAEQINDIFGENLGAAYGKDRYAEIQKEADVRIAAKAPPGYKDSKKSAPYGDIILWYQIIDHAKSQQKPIVLVTNDAKEDWWREHEGKIIGPRHELVAELREQAGVQFYMYRTEQFIKLAEEFLGLNEQPSVVEEIREIQQQDEAERLQSEFAIPIDQVSALLGRLRGELDTGSLAQQAKALAADSFANISVQTAKTLAADSFANISAQTAKTLAADSLANISAQTAKTLAADSLAQLYAAQEKFANVGSVAQIYADQAKLAGVGLLAQLAAKQASEVAQFTATSQGSIDHMTRLANSPEVAAITRLANSPEVAAMTRLANSPEVAAMTRLANSQIMESLEHPAMRQPKRKPKQPNMKTEDPTAQVREEDEADTPEQ